MFERFHRKSASATLAAVLAALGIGGVAVAQGGGANPSTSTPAPAKTQSQTSGNQAQEVPGQESNAPENSAADPDNVQQGDQTGTDANDKADGPESASDKAGGGAEQEPGSEVANDDGPGGHADEPGNSNADTQQQGQH